eukprot:m.258711 g.258711  ORF g.258711 m.258711 type:complete len:204 (+) comp21761_c0_seq1:126-737(+)
MTSSPAPQAALGPHVPDFSTLEFAFSAAWMLAKINRPAARGAMQRFRDQALQLRVAIPPDVQALFCPACCAVYPEATSSAVRIHAHKARKSVKSAGKPGPRQQARYTGDPARGPRTSTRCECGVARITSIPMAPPLDPPSAPPSCIATPAPSAPASPSPTPTAASLKKRKRGADLAAMLKSRKPVPAQSPSSGFALEDFLSSL